MLEQQLGDLRDAVIGLLGLSFKPGTDDLRHAPSLRLAKALLEQGAILRGYDPVAMDGARRLMPDMQLYGDAYALARGADALILVTEWPEFLQLDMPAIKDLMRRPILFDGRNVWNGEDLERLGFAYAGFGVKSSAEPAGANGRRFSGGRPHFSSTHRLTGRGRACRVRVVTDR